jgi:putative ABC transport system substrate-binding protein
MRPVQLSRRSLIRLSAAVVAWPAALGAQPAGRLPIIGVLGASTASNWSSWTAAFVQRLRELGWSEGRTVAIEYRWAEGHPERYAEIAAELVRLKADVIVTVGSAASVAMQATSTIPIVFAMGTDPVGTGLVASLARPGGNVTGLSIQSSDLAGKRLELLREVLPDLRRLAVLANIDPALRPDRPNPEIAEVQAAARQLGLELDMPRIQHADDIPLAFDSIKDRAQAIYVVPDPLINANHARINSLALEARLPTLHPFRDYLGAGGFMSYGANNADLFRRAGDYVHKILRGAKPAELPVEQPIRFDLVFNLRAARRIGISVPPTLLARADEVIE